MSSCCKLIFPIRLFSWSYSTNVSKYQYLLLLTHIPGRFVLLAVCFFSGCMGVAVSSKAQVKQPSKNTISGRLLFPLLPIPYAGMPCPPGYRYPGTGSMKECLL